MQDGRVRSASCGGEGCGGAPTLPLNGTFETILPAALGYMPGSCADTAGRDDR